MSGRTPRRMPNAAGAVVEERRIREYLLDLEHAAGGPKARFFIARGFASDAWNLLQAALITQGRVNTATRSVETAWGTRYTVECNYPTPDGPNPCIRTVWQMEENTPSLLTAIPL